MTQFINKLKRSLVFTLLSYSLVMPVLLSCTGITDNKILEKKKPNVLFIIADDLRPDLGVYGNNEIQTPNIDALAKKGMAFTQAYSQTAACSPSRASTFLGKRPDSTGVLKLGDKFREINPNAVTIPQYFSKFGYHTVSLGKIFHNHMPDRVSFDEPDLRPTAYMTPELINRDPESFYHDEEIKKEHALVREKRIAKNPNAYAGGWAYGRSTESFDAPDNAFYDGAQTDLALEVLERLKGTDKPFFMALGYYRPHMPFVAPKKYWDMYDRDKISLALNDSLPENSPSMAINTMYELRANYDLLDVGHPASYKMPEERARRLKHGYYASVSFIDANVGRLLKGLKELGLDDNTIIVFWGDHGFKLGEHGSWAKQTNYNIDTRVPFIISDPRMKLAGDKIDSLVELVDLFPTITDLAGIELPDEMEGISLRGLLEQPDKELKSAVFSQYIRRHGSANGEWYRGFSIVTTTHHYVQWHLWDDKTKTAGEQVAIELYDLVVDPEENTNIAELVENAKTISTLSAKLRAGWEKAVL